MSNTQQSWGERETAQFGEHPLNLEADANAALIAAAPELLRELTTSAGNFETLAAYLEQLQAAGVAFPSQANTPSLQATIEGLRIRAGQVRAAIAKAEGRT